MLLLGAGKTKIELPEILFPIETYNGVHDDLYARAILLQSGISFLIVSFDVTSLRSYAIDRFRSEAAKAAGIPQDHIWLCVSHTFSAPHLRSEEALTREGGEIAHKNQILFDSMSNAMIDAIRQAKASMEPVKLTFGHAFCQVNVNRDMYTINGWWLGADDLGESDKTVPFIRFDSTDGQPKAVIYSYDVQSSIMDHSKGTDGYGKVTGDLVGAASRFIESQYGESFVALFLLGAAGDQAPLFKADHNIPLRDGSFERNDIGDEGFSLVNALGKKLGAQTVQAMERATQSFEPVPASLYCGSVTCPGQKIAPNLKDIHPTRSYRFESDQEHEITFSIFTMGHIALIGLAPELSSTTAIDIKKDSPYLLTMIVTMVNGGDKYMPEQTAYDRITYEAMNSKFAQGSAELLADRILGTLKSIQKEEAR
ncbi:MAG: hypothetical protein LUD07_02975 [Clostridiales bacterium]|nr:hypothetical protein [Clostridiales bacterium]